MFGTKPADFLITGEEKPRFNLRGMEDVTKSENATAIIAANTLGTHENIFIRGKANVADWFIMNGVQMCDQHDGSLPVNEDKIAFADESSALENFAEPFKELLLSGTEKMFERNHAGTSIF